MKKPAGRNIISETAVAPTRTQPWQEKIEDDSGLTLARSHAPNDDLIGLGDEAQHGRWPIDNQ